ncbi:hypothetical protein A2U01_0114360, partial [Trifolium medium]|nr:hypothetical protein [Trifolium medium]
MRFAAAIAALQKASQQISTPHRRSLIGL